jgi:hypothetical protein
VLQYLGRYTHRVAISKGAGLFWQIKEDRKRWRESREGAYLPRTNLQAETAEELWSTYMQLTEAETSFRVEADGRVPTPAAFARMAKLFDSLRRISG